MVKAAGNKSHPAVLFFRTFLLRGVRSVPPSKVAIYKAFRRLEPSKIGSKPQKRAKMGYDSYLPKRPVCRYHNIREVATHEIRNTVTQGKGLRPTGAAGTREVPRIRYARGLPAHDRDRSAQFVAVSRWRGRSSLCLRAANTESQGRRRTACERRMWSLPVRAGGSI